MECEVIIIFVRADLISRHCHVIWAIVSSTLCHLVIVRTIVRWGVDRWIARTGPSLSLSPQMTKTGLFSLLPPEWFRKADP